MRLGIAMFTSNVFSLMQATRSGWCCSALPLFALSMLTGILCLTLPGYVLAQPNLVVDNTTYDVNYNGTYQDFTVPGNAARIILNLKGGDGGKARIRYADCCLIDNVCNANGGEGASVSATFMVGDGAGKIPPGSIIRFIVGGAGESGNNNNTFAGWEVGGGGGATGILYKAPSMSNFEPLTIAGAGGGAYRGIALGICADNSSGRGGNYGPNGDGGGGDIDPGNGGTGGNGGGGNELAGGGGGGYLTDGDGVTCVGLTSSFGVFSNEAGEGHKADDTGSPGGTSEGCTAFSGWSNGGYGYGSGGSGSDVGGGGGGYSGGGKGGTTGGGGGGGSYVNPIRLSESGSDGGTTGSPQNGMASYRVIPRPDNDLCGGARVLTCGSTSTGSTEYATNDDAPGTCGTGSNAEGVWFTFLGTGDAVTLSGAGSSFTPQINVYSGSCSALTCVGGGNNSYTFCTQRFAPYYVYVDGTPVGNYQISLTCNPQPPSIVCPVSFSKNTDPNLCTAVVEYEVTASDNCGILSKYRTAGLPSGSAFPKGPTTVTWEAIDNALASTSCSFTVTVVDNQAPVMTCPNLNRTSDPGQCGAMVTYAPNVVENCPNAVLTVTSGLASGSFFPVGVSTINLKVTDGANLTTSCVFTVTVTDAQNPVITCPANIVRSASLGTCTAVVDYATPTATDNCPGVSSGIVPPSKSSGSVFSKGTTSVIWEATDGAGRTARCTFTVTVNDNQAPTITCPANKVVGSDPNLCSATVSYSTPSASDNCALAPNSPSLQSGIASGGIFPKGQTTVVWRATDESGLTKTCSFRVTVNDTQAPNISCPAAQSVSTSAGSCSSASVTYATPTATDNCAPTPTVVRIGGLASGASFPLGITNVVWRAIDGSGGSSTCSFAVTVTDVASPTITCPNNVAVTAPAGQCSMPVAYATPTATDNCSVQQVLLLSGLASGSTFPQGVTTNTWRAVDNSGLSSTCSFTVTVSCGANSEQGGMSREQLALGLIPGTSMDEPLALGLSLFPNPAQDEVQVSIENLGATGGELVLHDARGRMMLKQRVESSVVSRQSGIAFSPSRFLTFSVLDFPAGLYFVTLQTAEGKTVTKRLAKAVD